MEAFFEFLKANPFLLLFLTVGLAVWIGKFSVKGYGLGMVAAAIVVGVALATWASTYGVKLQLDNFAKSLMYYLFMYGVGLRVGPSFFNSLKKDGCDLHHPRRGLRRSRPGPGRGPQPDVWVARRRGGRSPRRLPDHVGGYRHGGNGGQPRGPTRCRREQPPKGCRR